MAALYNKHMHTCMYGQAHTHTHTILMCVLTLIVLTLIRTHYFIGLQKIRLRFAQ